MDERAAILDDPYIRRLMAQALKSISASPLPPIGRLPPICRHLVEQRLKPGDLLPPIRQLALDLGVHFNTVALAYRMLAGEGWLELRRRRGAVVMARSAPRSMDRTRVDQLVQQLGHIAAELRSAGMSARQISAALQRLAHGARP